MSTTREPVRTCDVGVWSIVVGGWMERCLARRSMVRSVVRWLPCSSWRWSILRCAAVCCSAASTQPRTANIDRIGASSSRSPARRCPIPIQPHCHARTTSTALTRTALTHTLTLYVSAITASVLNRLAPLSIFKLHTPPLSVVTILPHSPLLSLASRPHTPPQRHAHSDTQ